MLRVVILINPDYQPCLEEPKSQEIQQLKGIESRITAHVKESHCFTEISIHSDRNSDLKSFSQLDHNGHTICIASGEEGLCALNFMARQLDKKIDRKQWALIWVGINYIEMLASTSCKIDFAVFPHWQESMVIQKLQIAPRNYNVIFDFIGIYSDMRRDFSCFTPKEEHLPIHKMHENAKIIGFILGGHCNGKILPRELVEHWLKTLCEHVLSNNESVYFIFMDSPVTMELPDKGDTIRSIIIENLKHANIPYTFVSCQEKIVEDASGNNDSLNKIPMILNWIENRSGDIYVTSDNLGDIYNVLGCTQLLQSPYVYVLMPNKPHESDYIDQNFFNYYKDEWNQVKFETSPWIIISKHATHDSRAFDDELLTYIDKHLETQVIIEEQPQQSMIARICHSLSNISLFYKSKPPYTSVELSETKHDKHVGNEVSNPLNPAFTIE